ncbi:hypothetical protein JTE90_022628 [Oedothorax gibbosus]|uniref:Uncharacterized protein n=1 Tax=Oedothorax gibbosus TaxID=931172 RepID=A0AAV6TUS0_9ARAC|nr:hypothetical protein JTE90_022628 [Oedothorax gibbosus]
MADDSITSDAGSSSCPFPSCTFSLRDEWCKIKMNRSMMKGCMMDAAEGDRRQCQLICNMVEAILADEQMATRPNDSISILTLKLRILSRILRCMNLSFEEIQLIQDTHILVHPENAGIMMQLCSKAQDADLILCQDFIPPDRLIKLIRFMCKHGHSNTAQALLAIDGLGGVKLNNAPNMDVKRYLDNLKIGSESAQNIYDQECGWKPVHVRTVRKVYEELAKYRAGALEHDVYQVMCQVLEDRASIVLPKAANVAILEPKVLEACVNVYNTSMADEYLLQFVEVLKNKIETNEPPQKRPKKRKAKKETDAAEGTSEEVNSATTVNE